MEEKKNRIENEDFIQIEETAKEDRNKKRLLILVLGITTVVVALIGASFAWFTSTINNIKGNESIFISAAVLEGVTFQASDNLALMNALPGDSIDTTFTITNPNNSAKVRYSLKFVADVNEFTNEDGDGQLMVTITGGDIAREITLDFTDGNGKKETPIITNVDLNSKESDVYKVKLEFKDIGKNQISNQKKNFVGHIEITQSIAVQ